MKKNIYIATLIFGLTAVSCQKQEFTPNVGAEADLPVWDSSSRLGEEHPDLDEGHGSNDSETLFGDDITDPDNDPDGDVSVGSDGGITDPNNDPDGDTETDSDGEITDPDNDPDGDATPEETDEI